MGLIYDDPQLAALTLTRIAAEESEGLSELANRERDDPPCQIEALVLPRIRDCARSFMQPKLPD